MSKKPTALTLMLALLFTAIVTPSFANFASARVNSADVKIYPWDAVFNTSPVISVNTPSNYTTYYDNVFLNFTVSPPTQFWFSNIESLEDVGYILDNNSYGPFPANTNLINYSTDIISPTIYP
jgi:hypothetical protein